MTELPNTPESFFTIRAFDAARQAGGIAIEHNVEVITELDAFLKQEGARGLQVPAEYVDFAHYWTGGHSPAVWDAHFHKANLDTNYLPGSQLALPTHAAADITKADIIARGRPVVEIATADYSKPLVGALARALIVPEPKDAGMAASPKAWGEQIRSALTFRGLLDAFTPDFSNSGNPKLEAEAALRFAGAIVLKTR